MTAIILTGDKKPLFCDLNPELPASLIPVLNEPFLYWVTHWVKSQGFTQIVYAANQNAEPLDIWVNEASSADPSLCLDVIKEPQPLGTGSQTATSAKRFPSDIYLVIAGDTLLPIDLSSAMNKMRTNPNLDGIIFGSPFASAGRLGSLVIDNNQLLNFQAKGVSASLANAGVYLLKPSLLETIQTDTDLSIEADCFPSWLSTGKNIEVISTDVPFIEVSTPETLQKAQKQIEEYKNLIMNPTVEEVV